MSDEDIDEPVLRARKNKPLTKTAGCDNDRDLYVLLTCALLGYYRWQGGLLHCACAVCSGDCACACRRLLTTGRPAYDRNTTSRLVRSWCQSSSPARRTGFRGQTERCKQSGFLQVLGFQLSPISLLTKSKSKPVIVFIPNGSFWYSKKLGDEPPGALIWVV